MKKLFFLTALSIYATSLTQEEPVSIPKILANQSQHIENLRVDTADLNLTSVVIPGATQNTVDQLAKIYKNKANILPTMTLTELIHTTNLEAYLFLKQPKNDLINELINRIKNTPLNQLTPLQELSSDKSLEIMRILIKKEHIDSYLLKHYSNWLAKNPKIIENNTMEAYSSSEDLLFFNDHIKIYGIIYGFMSEPNVYDKIVIKQKNMPIKEINFPDFREDFSINVNKDSTYCVLYKEDMSLCNTNTYELWSLTGTPTQYTLDSTLTSYCFANNDTLCSADSNGTISLFDLKRLTHINTIATVKLQENEVIKHLEYRSKTDNRPRTIVALTNKGTVYIIKNNTVHKLPAFSEFPQNNMVYDINLDHSGNCLCIITIKTPLNPVWKTPHSLFLLDISSNEHKPIAVPITTPSIDIIKPHWTQNDALLTIIYRCRSESGFYHDYIAMNPNTANTWKLNYPDAVADNGNSYIQTISTLFSTTTKKTTICDKVMTNALDYLNANKAMDKTPTQRLFGTILLYAMSKKQKSSIFDNTEQSIYSNNLSPDIQTILTTTNIIKITTPSTQIKEQNFLTPIVTPIKNFFNTAYTSLTQKLSDYRFKLLLGGASIVSIVAAYQHLKSKQQ